MPTPIPSIKTRLTFCDWISLPSGIHRAKRRCGFKRARRMANVESLILRGGFYTTNSHAAFPYLAFCDCPGMEGCRSFSCLTQLTCKLRKKERPFSDALVLQR